MSLLSKVGPPLGNSRRNNWIIIIIIIIIINNNRMMTRLKGRGKRRSWSNLYLSNYIESVWRLTGIIPVVFCCRRNTCSNIKETFIVGNGWFGNRRNIFVPFPIKRHGRRHLPVKQWHVLCTTWSDEKDYISMLFVEQTATIPDVSWRVQYRVPTNW